MAKLIKDENSGTIQAPQGGVTVAPAAFTAMPVGKERKQTETKVKAVKDKQLRGQEWANENLEIGNTDNVIQMRKYDLRGGFHCIPCGVPGRYAYVVRGKEGRGVPLKIYDVDDKSEHFGKEIGEVTGFLLGATCLKKYANIDVSKLDLVASTKRAVEASKTEAA